MEKFKVKEAPVVGPTGSKVKARLLSHPADASFQGRLLFSAQWVSAIRKGI